MSNCPVVGKIYNLEFYDSEADVEDYLQSVANLSGTYKLVAEGMIPWGKNNCENFKYYLFKNRNDNLIEVFIDIFDEKHRYSSLIFYNGDSFETDNYSDYINYGEKEFPEFNTYYMHIRVNIKLSEI